MSTIAETLSSNQVRSFNIQADYMRILSGTSLRVTFFRHGSVIQESNGVGAGYSARFREPFDRFDVADLSGASNAISILLGSGVTIDINSVSGSVSVSNMPATAGAYANSRQTVGTGAVVVLAAANASRRGLQIQNASAGDYLRLTGDGVDPTALQGLRIGPGDLWEPPAGYMPTGAIKAIAETGSINVEVFEG